MAERSAKKIALQGHRRCIPVPRVIHKCLPTVVQLQQIAVGVQVLDLFCEASHQRGLARAANVEDELAIELV